MSNKHQLGKMYVYTKCGHQVIGKPTPHQCSEGWDEDPLLFRKATPEDVKETSQAVAVIDAKVTVVSPLDQRDQEIAEDISRAYEEAKRHVDTAIRKVVVCGLLLTEQKSRGKHGEFGPWLEQHCPEISWKTACAWMNTAQVVCESLQILPEVKFGNFPLHQVLQLPETVLPKEAKAVQEKVFNFVDGKSQKQLLFDFRDLDAKPKGGFRPDEKAVQKWLKKHHPDLAGTKFADLPKDIQKEFRADYERSKLSAKERAELEIQEAEEAVAQLIGDIELVVLKGDTMGLVSDETRKALLQKGEAMNAHLREINKAAKGGKSK